MSTLPAEICEKVPTPLTSLVSRSSGLAEGGFSSFYARLPVGRGGGPIMKGYTEMLCGEGWNGKGAF